jgi:hypothetical protein
LSGAVDQGDVVLTKFILDSGGLPASNLSEALEAAKTANKAEIVALLEQAGAKVPDEFKMDAAQLERFAGTYKNPAGIETTVVVAGTRLSLGAPGAPPAQRGVLAAKDAVTFRGIGMGGVSVVFKLEGEKVTGFNMVLPQGNSIVYTRVEGK